ncbi:MAG TPA: putative PEP-binding protein, partial [Ktedonobacterales bacterium]|nr:putative PEP-binding protein [Ktedonobacterales bacterium]
GLDMPAEANPFLGWRGIRLALDRPDEVFLPQLRAILRAAVTADMRLMFPMITTPQEVTQAQALIERAMADLTQSHKPARRVPIGIMVETPAAALTLDQFRGIIDFASIGTNDLVQYTYAVDRSNPQVQKRAQPLGLATLRLIEQICNSGISISVCGQMASDLAAIPLLVGLGVRTLSVAAAAVPSVKQILDSYTLPQMRRMAALALDG